MRAWQCVLLAGALLYPAAARPQQAATTPDLALEVAYQPLQPPGGTAPADVEVALTNRSSKDIIAYGLRVSAFDRSSLSWKSAGFGLMTEDFVTSFAAVGRSAPITDKYTHIGPIHPGGTIYKRMSFLATDPAGPLEFSVTLVNFGDDTALGDAAQIDSLLGRRRAWADQIDAALPKLRAPGSAAELRQMLSQWTGGGIPESAAPTPLARTENANWRAEQRTVLSREFGAVVTKTDVGLIEWRSFEVAVLSDLLRDLRSHSQRKGDY
ncbi:MAG: hypothetical protein ACLQGV_04420 [Bryobacteraceae bacterium]